MKRRHSATEQALIVAEKVERICRLTTGDELQPTEVLGRAWRSLLFSQFHDALGGTCTERSDEGIDLMVAEARAVADRVTTLALHRLARHVDTWTEAADRAEGQQASALAGLPIPLLVVNPLSWAVTRHRFGPLSLYRLHRRGRCPPAAATRAVGRGDRQPYQHPPAAPPSRHGVPAVLVAPEQARLDLLRATTGRPRTTTRTHPSTSSPTRCSRSAWTPPPATCTGWWTEARGGDGWEPKGSDA